MRKAWSKFTPWEIWLTLLKAILTSQEQCIAKNSLLPIYNIKQISSREPKFHKVEIFEGLVNQLRVINNFS